MRNLKFNSSDYSNRSALCLLTALLSLLIPSLFFANHALAQSKTTAIKTPAGVVFPWHTVGIDPSMRASLKESFIQSQTQINQAFLNQSQSLT